MIEKADMLDKIGLNDLIDFGGQEGPAYYV